MASIPASQIVSVTPSVLSAGGTALDMNAVVLTQNTRVPIGTVPSFPTATAVSQYFGPSSTEYLSIAVPYFLGFDNSNKKPGALLFVQYPPTNVSAYLRGGAVSSLSLAQLQSISGSLTVPVDGVNKTTASVSLASATSFSNAAGLLATALSANITYDSIAGAFVVTSATSGTPSTVGFATGTISAALGLTQAVGAVISPGAAAATPATAMASVAGITANWATFLTTWEAVTADVVAFAAWANGQNNNYLYISWNTDITATQTGGTTSAGYLIGQASYSGTALIYSPTNGATIAAFLAGSIASLDFSETNGRTTLAFRGQSGLAPDVTSGTAAANLEANGYNYYGSFDTANDQFTFLYPGCVSGQWKWIDSYVDQIWLTNQLQLAMVNLLVSAKSIPYNRDGYGLIYAAAADPVNRALNFGAIRAGVTLSALQIAEINAAAGASIAQTITNVGWYFQVQDASPQVRAARGSPPITLWYSDGESVQRIALGSVEVQ